MQSEKTVERTGAKLNHLTGGMGSETVIFCQEGRKIITAGLDEHVLFLLVLEPSVFLVQLLLLKIFPLEVASPTVVPYLDLVANWMSNLPFLNPDVGLV